MTPMKRFTHCCHILLQIQEILSSLLVDSQSNKKIIFYPANQTMFSHGKYNVLDPIRAHNRNVKIHARKRQHATTSEIVYRQTIIIIIAVICFEFFALIFFAFLSLSPSFISFCCVIFATFSYRLSLYLYLDEENIESNKIRFALLYHQLRSKLC